MPLFRTPPAPSWKRPDGDPEQVIAGYLALSRSPLRSTEPEWFALAEQVEWERVCAVAGVRAAPPGADAP